jgi:hypothetical protein
MWMSDTTAQGTDSLAANSVDSITAAKNAVLHKNMELSRKILSRHPYFNFTEKAGYPPYTVKTVTPGKELYFYIVAGLFLMFAIFKASFDKYFTDLINLFFRRSLKQRQLKQQVVQNSLPSLLFNVLFIITAGFYGAMAIQKNIDGSQLELPLWQLFIYTTAAIGIIYLGKYFILKFIGWVFRISKLTDNYIFLIFLVNKVLTILILPLIIVIALSVKPISTIAWTLSWLLIAGFILYRYISAIGIVRKDNSISFFHFILYVGAFEILPTVILYKGILSILK